MVEVRTARVDLPKGNNYLCHREQLFRLHSDATPVQQADIMKGTRCHAETDSLLIAADCRPLNPDRRAARRTVVVQFMNINLYLPSKHLAARINPRSEGAGVQVEDNTLKS